MPIKSCALPDGKSGWKWGDHGNCYADRADAERQAAAAHASGFVGDALAFDRGSVRTYDQDGRLHVAVTNISKANICPYRGDEIPGWEELGLDPQRVYQLLRDPDELAKAAPTFNNIPLLSEHVPVSAAAPRQDLIIGSTGTDAEFSVPYLRNSLVVWVADAIADIESGKQRELSAAYHYDPDMTPGVFNGAHFDGVMRNIRGNHEALVPVGRAGSDVVVGDSAMERTYMPKALSRKAAMARGALTVALKPKLAQDAKIDLNKVLAGVTAKNWKAQKPSIVAGLTSALKGKLAQDADVGDVVKLLDVLDDDDDIGLDDDMPDATDVTGDEPADPAVAPKPVAKDDADGDGDVEAALAKIVETIRGLLGKDKPDAAMDEPPPTPGTPAPPATSATAKKDDDKVVSKPAMDAAIAAAVNKARAETEATTIARLRDIAAAEDAVRPYVGKLAISCDSAEGVYKAALETMGIDIIGVTGTPAYRAILTAHGRRSADLGAPAVAMDAAGATEFEKAFPGASRIKL